MSRVGKLAVTVPAGVDVKLDGGAISVKGPKGELHLAFGDQVAVQHENGAISVEPRDRSDARCRAMWGTIRAHVANMVKGVCEGFERGLELSGVGYRAQMRGNDLELSLGFSHPVVYAAPEGVTLAVPAVNRITVSGADIQKVGQAAAEIRRFRPPEPYKGKGVRMQGEHVRRKAGKKK